jgi:hypothetical protein
MSGWPESVTRFEPPGQNWGIHQFNKMWGDEELEPSRLRRAQAEQVELCTKAVQIQK